MGTSRGAAADFDGFFSFVALPGETDVYKRQELNRLQKLADAKKWPLEAKSAFDREIIKARRINPQIAEYSVILNYLELMLDLPWNDVTKDNFNLKKVRSVLDKDHFGLEDVKNRIIEHLAVLKLKGDMKAPILCLVGPPGVGKTLSLIHILKYQT